MTAPLVPPGTWDALSAQQKADRLNALLGNLQPIIAQNSLAPSGLTVLYPLTPPVASGNTGSVPINTLSVSPWICPFTGTLDQLQMKTTATGGAGSLYRFGLYQAVTGPLGVPIPGFPYPGALLFDSGQQDGTVVTTNSISVSIPVIAGQLYFSAYFCGVGAPTINLVNPGSTSGCYGLPGSLNATIAMGLTRSITFGALPNPWPFGNVGILSSVPEIVGRYL